MSNRLEAVFQERIRVPGPGLCYNAPHKPFLKEG